MALSQDEGREVLHPFSSERHQSYQNIIFVVTDNNSCHYVGQTKHHHVDIDIATNMLYLFQA